MFTYADLASLTLEDIEFVATWESLKDYVGASDADTEFVQRCWIEAVSLVSKHVGAAVVPNEVKVRAVLEVGSELFHRRNAPNGIAQFSAIDGSAIRVARDPMIGAYPILSRFVGAPIA